MAARTTNKTPDPETPIDPGLRITILSLAVSAIPAGHPEQVLKVASQFEDYVLNREVKHD